MLVVRKYMLWGHVWGRENELKLYPTFTQWGTTLGLSPQPSC